MCTPASEQLPLRLRPNIDREGGGWVVVVGGARPPAVTLALVYVRL